MSPFPMGDKLDFPSFDDHSRALAHRVVDLLFDHVSTVETRPVVAWSSPVEIQNLVRASADSSPQAMLEAVENLLRYSVQLHHPSYMGHQVCPPLPAAVISELVISGLNQSMAVWEMSPMATMVEVEIVRWLCDLAGYPGDAAGTAVSGGSAANITALLAARARWRNDSGNEHKRPVVLCSEESHYSIDRAASVMGLDKADVLHIPVDASHRMNVGALSATLEALEETERTPLAIVATAGSTATGSFDRLWEIADVRDRFRTWLHVDAAHGASVLFSPALQHLVAGLERADSLSWDPHKMMWMPLSLGLVLVRQGRWLRSAFEAHAPYLFHEGEAPNLGEMTLQCSRRADILKLWLTLRAYGVEPIRNALEQCAARTRELYDLIGQADDLEALHEPEFNILCFRYRVGGKSESELDALNLAIRQKLIASGAAWITTTRLNGKHVLRVTLINPRSGREELMGMLAAVRRFASAGN